MAVRATYPAYQESGLPWVPKVPQGWNVLRNGRLFAHRVQTGFPDLPILEVSLRTGVRVRDMENLKRKQVMSQKEKYKRAAKGDIAYNMMNINAVKGVEIGKGFGVAAQKGSTHGDEMHPDGFATNNAGGVLGGISTGQDLRVSIAIKPTSSIHSPKHSIDIDGKPIHVQTKGRHDPCVGIRATPIAEAMLALVLMDHALRHRAQCGDVNLDIDPIPAARPGTKSD